MNVEIEKRWTNIKDTPTFTFVGQDFVKSEPDFLKHVNSILEFRFSRDLHCTIQGK